jgi:hypothetical protein
VRAAFTSRPLSIAQEQVAGGSRSGFRRHFQRASGCVGILRNLNCCHALGTRVWQPTEFRA